MPSHANGCAAGPACEQRSQPHPNLPSRQPRRGHQALHAGLMLAGVAWGNAQAAAISTPDAPPAAHAAQTQQAPADLATQVLRLVNLRRARQGLPDWEPDTALAAIATAHSQRMAQRRQIGHDGFDARFAQARRRHCVENLAAGFDSAEPLLAAWLASPSHRDNLLAQRPRQVGLGQVAGYVTLMACEPALP